MKTMKVVTSTYAGLMLILLCAVAQGADLPRALDTTIEDVAKEAAKRLNATSFKDVNNVAILPLWGEFDKQTKDYLVRTLQSSIVGGPYHVMERSTPAWDNLLSEIKWDQLQEGAVNQQTVQRFGRIVGCDAVIYGTLRECTIYPATGQAVTRLTLTMGIVETGEAKWSSGEVKSVRILPSPVSGPRDLNPALIRAINQCVAKAAESLQGSGTVVNGFCVFPLLGGDDDGYMCGVLHSHLAKTGCNPALVSADRWEGYLVANSGDRRSVESMRSFARENGYKAFLWGTMNECKVLERKYKGVARMTLHLATVEAGQTVWGPGEIIGTSWLDWQDAFWVAVYDPIVWVVGGLAVIVIFWRALRNIVKVATRPR